MNGMMSFIISSLKGSLVASEVITCPPPGVQPDGMTTIIGSTFFSAIRLSRMSLARPTVYQIQHGVSLRALLVSGRGVYVHLAPRGSERPGHITDESDGPVRHVAC